MDQYYIQAMLRQFNLDYIKYIIYYIYYIQAMLHQFNLDYIKYIIYYIYYIQAMRLALQSFTVAKQNTLQNNLNPLGTYGNVTSGLIAF